MEKGLNLKTWASNLEKFWKKRRWLHPSTWIYDRDQLGDYSQAYASPDLVLLAHESMEMKLVACTEAEVEAEEG